MRANLDAVLKYILEDEGGYAKHGPGGITNLGISFTLFKDVWYEDKHFRLKFYPDSAVWPDPSYETLANLTAEGACYIYEKHVFPKIKFDDLPSGLDYVMANTAVMEGPTGASKILQYALDLTVTGVFDWNTIDTIKQTGIIKTISGVLLHQANAKLHDPRVERHGPGWGNRIIQTWNRALEMINK